MDNTIPKKKTVNPKILLIEDNLQQQEFYRDYFEDNHIDIVVVSDPKSISDIYLQSLNQKIDGIFIDINLSEFNQIKIPLNGIEIANTLRKYHFDNMPIAVVSTDIKSAMIKKNLEEMQPNINIYEKSDESNDFIEEVIASISTTDGDIEKCYAERNPNDLLFILEEPCWIVEKNGSLSERKGPKLKKEENNIIFEDNSEYIMPYKEEIPEETIVFWNFSSKEYLHFIMKCFIESHNEMKSNEKLLKMFNSQASRWIARYHVLKDIEDLNVQNYLSYLTQEGIFIYQKDFLLNMFNNYKNNEIEFDEYEYAIQHFLEINKSQPIRIIDIYIGRITEIEQKTQTVWVNFENIITQNYMVEAFSEKVLKDENIEIFPTNSFNYIISKNSITGLSRKIEQNNIMYTTWN